MDYTPTDYVTATDSVGDGLHDHYAHGFASSGLLASGGLQMPQLWSARDLAKDQSYFLSGVAAEQLVLFLLITTRMSFVFLALACIC